MKLIVLIEFSQPQLLLIGSNKNFKNIKKQNKMITVIICALGALFAMGWMLVEYFEFYDFSTLIMGVLASLLSMVTGGLLGLLIGLLLGQIHAPEVNEKISHTYYLQNIQDSNSIDGHFFLGCGSFDGKMTYTFYHGDSINGYKMNQIDYNDALIKYTNESPKIVHVEYEQSNFTFAINKRVLDDEYIIYIPEGSIKTEFKLDAK